MPVAFLSAVRLFFHRRTLTDFRRITNRILATAKHGRIGIRAFEAHLPGIAKQIRQDGRSSWLDNWGHSLNVDEHEAAPIVDPKLLNVIGRLAQHPIRDGRSYHAGLIHTYGYLLSNLKTRFGYKRQRWLDGLIEQSLQLERGVLSTDPPQGTLLQNVTYLISQIASDAKPINSAPETIPASLLRLNLASFRITRIVEKVQLGRSRSLLKVQTDIVHFRSGCPLESFLVYSIEQRRKRQLITCFPMRKQHVQQLVSDAERNDTPIRPRFNLAVPDFPKSGIMGKRTVEQR